MAIKRGEIAPVDPFLASIVGTTSAGDSFLDMLLVALATGAGLKEAAGAVSAVPALATTSVGAQASYGDITAVKQHFG